MVIWGQAPKRTTRVQYGKGKPRPTRMQEQAELIRLCRWAQRWRQLPELPNICEALIGMHTSSRFAKRCTLIPAIVIQLRSVSSRSSGRWFIRTLLTSGRANIDAKRSVVAKRGLGGKLECILLQKLSHYYSLEQGTNTWKRPQLLRKGEHRLGRSMR